MQLLLISILFVALAMFLLSFNIIFRKDGKFPETEVGHNLEMQKLGLKCAKAEEKSLWKKGGKGDSCCCNCQ
ncbi:MAG: hypothetical protein WC960_05270 [Bacteroidales bacterium]